MQAFRKTQTFIPQTTATSRLSQPRLQLGSVGEGVVELQKLLSYYEIYQGPLNGNFDQSLKNAVLNFQHCFFLKEDGIVGTLTWQALYSGAPIDMPLLKPGSRGHAVISLQRLLQLTGDYKAPIDGQFDAQTEAAVREFQERNSLMINGIVSSQTWLALSNLLSCAY
ncbi:MAG: peptidoglycan-binding protein [Xenococcaceae cyanobacterium]